MSTLVKIVKAQDQDRDIYCECHGNVPLEKLYVVKDGGPLFRACLLTFLEMRGMDGVCQGDECLNATKDTYCGECAIGAAEAVCA